MRLPVALKEAETNLCYLPSLWLIHRRAGSGGPPPRRHDSHGSGGPPSTGAPARRSSAGREPFHRSSSWSKGQQEALSLVSGAAAAARSSSPSRSPAGNRTPHSATPEPTAPKFSEEVLEKKTNALLQEYLSVKDLDVS